MDEKISKSILDALGVTPETGGSNKSQEGDKRHASPVGDLTWSELYEAEPVIGQAVMTYGLKSCNITTMDAETEFKHYEIDTNDGSKYDFILSTKMLRATDKAELAIGDKTGQRAVRSFANVSIYIWADRFRNDARRVAVLKQANISPAIAFLQSVMTEAAARYFGAYCATNNNCYGYSKYAKMSPRELTQKLSGDESLIKWVFTFGYAMTQTEGIVFPPDAPISSPEQFERMFNAHAGEFLSKGASILNLDQESETLLREVAWKRIRRQAVKACMVPPNESEADVPRTHVNGDLFCECDACSVQRLTVAVRKEFSRTGFLKTGNNLPKEEQNKLSLGFDVARVLGYAYCYYGLPGEEAKLIVPGENLPVEDQNDSSAWFRLYREFPVGDTPFDPDKISENEEESIFNSMYRRIDDAVDIEGAKERFMATYLMSNLRGYGGAGAADVNTDERSERIARLKKQGKRGRR